MRFLHAELAARYRESRRERYDAASYRRDATFSAFIKDYPALLGTCQRQLPPIPLDAASGVTPPAPACDCQRNLLSALSEQHGDALPRTLPCEHYRCDPVIIGLCNKKFHDGALIPFTSGDAAAGGGQVTSGQTGQPMIVARTVEGNHMRQHRGGGRSNQREIDVITQEVIPRYCPGVAQAGIGATTPCRHQAAKAADVPDQAEAGTVHKFQGRQKQVVILATVLDETWRGRTGHALVDDPQLINVAASRAVRRFILVTNFGMLPTSRHIRDLAGYVGYHSPGDEVTGSAVASVSDLLYQACSRRLRPLAARLRNELKYKSEDIIWTVLQDILAEPAYAHLTVIPQVLLRNPVPDPATLTLAQLAYVRHRAPVDFIAYNRVTDQPLLAIEVDGFAFHETSPSSGNETHAKTRSWPPARCRCCGWRPPAAAPQRIRRELDNAEACARTRHTRPHCRRSASIRAGCGSGAQRS